MNDDHITNFVGASINIGPTPCCFILKVGEGRVVIDLITGKVMLENCTVDEGAKAFWDAVERMGMRM